MSEHSDAWAETVRRMFGRPDSTTADPEPADPSRGPVVPREGHNPGPPPADDLRGFVRSLFDTPD
jgi:hypothetical protein